MFAQSSPQFCTKRGSQAQYAKQKHGFYYSKLVTVENRLPDQAPKQTGRAFATEPEKATGQKVVNRNPVHPVNEGREAVEVTLPISMHTGQIILLTKLLTATDLRFYDFSAGNLREGWHSPY